MPRVCTVCTHRERVSIDVALVDGDAFRNIAERFGLSATAVFRHKADHIPAALTQAQEAENVSQADDLLGQVRKRQAQVERLVGISEGLIGRAVQRGDLRTATAAVQAAVSANREVRACLELLAKLLGELDERPVLNLLVAPEWHQVRSALLEALLPYPEARTAVAARLMALEAA
jgi:hypothetical protein